MKKYAFFIFLLTFIVLSSSIFPNGGTANFQIQKIALLYEGETAYREYDITPNVTWTFNTTNDNYTAVSITTLTDESNPSLPSGVITEIKIYASINDAPPGWIVSGGGTGTVANAINWLVSNVELSTIKRKKVTCRNYSDGASPIACTHTEEPL